MAAEGASDSMDPRYAPPDPTLPEPWKGLIDGSSCVMYYWNPETSITQYEKPIALPAAVPSGPPPKSVSAPTTRTEQLTDIPGQQAPQMFSTPEHQLPPLQGINIPKPYQGVNMEPSQGYQFTLQLMHYMGYQQRPPNMMQPPQHIQQFSQQQDHRSAIPQREDAPLVPNQPSDVIPMQTPPTQYGRSQFNVQQPSSFGQLQQSSVDYQQHGPKFQNQMGLQPNVPPVGTKMGFEDNLPGIGGNEHHYNTKNGVPSMVPHQPKLAVIPMARTQQEMQSGGLVHQNVSPFHGGPTSHNMYGQATAGFPFMNKTMMSANPTIIASPDAMTLSSVDVYRKKHDVTATGDNVPAPFISFESTGFPPELLREKRSTCRTLPCYSHIYSELGCKI